MDDSWFLTDVRTPVFVGLCALTVAQAACTGSIYGPGQNPNNVQGGGGSGAGGGGMVKPTPVCTNHVIEPGATPMRLLSTAEYLATLTDLVGDVPGLSASLADDHGASALGIARPDVGLPELQTIQDVGAKVAATVVGNATTLGKLAPCDAATDKRTCAKNFVTTFGARAYRAPITDAADIERHLVVFDAGATTSYQHGIELVLTAMLQAPRFLYVVEVGTGEKVAADAVKLSGYEIAARLSYSVWGTMPDAKLTAAAAAGMLSTKEGVATQLAWMLADPRGQTMVRRFVEGWTRVGDASGLAKDAKAYPQWTSTPTLGDSMVGQARAFFDDVLASQGGKLSALLTSTKVFANQDLSSYYGGGAAGATFQPVTSASGTPSGMLTLPALLSILAKPDSSSPIYRGKFVREEMLCQQLPPPPNNVPKPPDVMAGVSTRERFRQHEVDPACSGCHQQIDPIGLGFENYDGVGRFRTMDNGQPVDASGEVKGSDDVDGKFNGVAELGQKLAGSQQVQSCLTKQWFRFMMTRFEQDSDSCSLADVMAKFHAGDGSLNVLPTALAQSDAFMYRRPLDSQVSP